MKRGLRILICLLLIVPFLNVNAKTTTTAAKKDPINFYIFYGSTCTHCADLHEFTAELEEDKDYNYMFNIVNYEVWGDTQNQNLMIKTYQYFGETDQNKMGVPLYVIGDYFSSGFPNKESHPTQYEAAVEEIKNAIKEAYEDDNYVDIVAGIGSGNIEVEEQEEDSKKKGDLTGYIVLGIAAVIVIGIIFARSRNTYYEDAE